AAGVVEVQKRLQVLELVCGTELLGRAPLQPDAVALRQLEQQLRLETALQVHVQVGLRQPADEGLGSSSIWTHASNCRMCGQLAARWCCRVAIGCCKRCVVRIIVRLDKGGELR